ncbi:YhcN/YlaJ family sporulation lipoprotein [Cohnella suwonensis]|uniref:YhcN/YlaJ family sporulation lipoprotein n=1 Tax=Cohnella suwonensis TaxID=696072 RepID=A0ABW0LQ84_9BACL
MKQSMLIACGTAALMLSALALGPAGCGNNSKSSAPESSSVRYQAQQAGNATEKTLSNPKQVSAHLESLARGVEGVKSANCVVFGKFAVVGIDVDSKMERSKVGTIKYAVAEAFRKDPYGIDAVVTADIDMAQRLREIRADTRAGRPIAGFAEELADIVGRLVPQIPRNVIPPMSGENYGANSVRKAKRQSETPAPTAIR